MGNSTQAGAGDVESTATATDADLSLETLVSRLLADDPALAQSLGRLDLPAERLLELIQPRDAEIRRSATSEAESLSVAEAQLKRASETAQSRRVRLPGFRWIVEKVNKTERRQRDGSIASTGIDALKTNAATARETLARALISRGLRPIVLQLRSERDQTEYTTHFRYVSARGLSEVYAPTIFELETPSFGQIRRLLDNTSGGSIGLAGPRGTGKTTVMSSFVEGRSRRSDEKRGRAIRVSAPVEYVTRDFILYLFAKLCESVLVPEPPFLRPYYADQPAKRFRSYYYRYAGQMGSLISGILLIWGLLVLFDAIFRFPLYSRYWLGPALIGAAVVTAITSRFVALNAYRNEREEEEYRLVQANRAWESSAQPRKGVSNEIASLASKYLDVIRFQQTYTDGWSGSLTASAGIVQGTAGITGGTSYLRNLLSLPEIVAAFKEFVAANVADAGPVIIGIDELDKIEGGDKAQAFLNDVKSVFGVEQCYFLISISEDALANFERRGLPVRDAFDSALDDVVRVRPLDYSTALTLIRIRIVGLPEPYAALIYCLGGGLPRDLIRWARAFVVAKDTTMEGLTELCGVVLREDLERKISASMVALSNDSESQVDSAIRLVGSLKLSAEPGWLLDSCDEILGSTLNNGQPSSEPTPDDGQSQAIPSGVEMVDAVSGRVLSQLFGYFYFAATLLEVFTDDLTEDQFAQLISDDAPGTISQLAHARQCFSANPWLAIDKISAFRAAQGLKRRVIGERARL